MTLKKRLEELETRLGHPIGDAPDFSQMSDATIGLWIEQHAKGITREDLEAGAKYIPTEAERTALDAGRVEEVSDDALLWAIATELASERTEASQASADTPQTDRSGEAAAVSPS